MSETPAIVIESAPEAAVPLETPAEIVTPQATTIVEEDIPPPTQEPTPTAVVVEEDIIPPQPDNKKRELEDAEPEPAVAKKRITRGTITKTLKERAMIDSELLTWGDWDEGNDWGDTILYNVVLKVDVLASDGTTVALHAGDKVPKAECILSKSAIILYPQGKIASAIVCPISLNVTQLKSLEFKQ
jgi:hypothetical protein